MVATRRSGSGAGSATSELAETRRALEQARRTVEGLRTEVAMAKLELAESRVENEKLKRRRDASKRLFGSVRRRTAALRGLALEDELTGLGNKRAFKRELNRVYNVFHRRNYSDPEMPNRRKPEGFTLLIFDLNFLKLVNDHLENKHIGGDIWLKEHANAILKTARGGDSAFRIGGDEIAVILNNGNGSTEGYILRLYQELGDNEILIGMCRQLSEKFEFAKKIDLSKGHTISIGAAGILECIGSIDPLKELFAHADSRGNDDKRVKKKELGLQADHR